MKSSSKNT